MNRWLPVLLAFLLFPAASLAHSEKEHAELLCAGFDAIEWRNEDGTRTDCLNAQYAVEVDYTYKWAEGVGQALYYAELHQRTPGIIFVCHPETTEEPCKKHVKRAMTILSTYAPQSVVWSCRHEDVSLDDCDTQTINAELADEGTSSLNDQQAALSLN